MPINQGTSAYENLELKLGQKLENIDTTAFEQELRELFVKHYDVLLNNSYNRLLSEMTNMHNQNNPGSIANLAIKYGIDPKKFSSFGYQFVVQDGLVAEHNSVLDTLNIYYATNKGINNEINYLYSKILLDRNASWMDDIRTIKNLYIEYAKNNGIEIENEVVLEKIPVNIDKVIAITDYISEIVNKKLNIDIREELLNEILNNYSTIFNYEIFDFSKLQTLKKYNYSDIDLLHLQLNDDNINTLGGFSYRVVYATPDYLKREYNKIMDEVKRLNSTDALLDGSFDIMYISEKKNAFRDYISKKNIEGIDISVPDVEIDYKKVELIVNGIMDVLSDLIKNKESLRKKITNNIIRLYPELVSERQVISLHDILDSNCMEDIYEYFGDQTLYIQKDFIYIGSVFNSEDKCLFATKDELEKKISLLYNKMSSKDIIEDKEKVIKALEKYANDNNIELNSSSYNNLKNNSSNDNVNDGMLDFFASSFIKEPVEEPSARAKIELNDNIYDIILKMSESVPGAIDVITNLLNEEYGVMYLLGLDDMNIRGSQIWVAYKYADEDVKKLIKCITDRDQNMIDHINKTMVFEGAEKAVTYGASHDRSQNPDKYRFTLDEVNEIKGSNKK